MKKILLLMLAMLMLLVMPACEKDDADKDNEQDNEQENVYPDTGDVMLDFDAPITLPEDVFE